MLRQEHGSVQRFRTLHTLETLKALEIELHQAEVRSNRARLEHLLHDSFVECGRSGRVYTRHEILQELSREVLNYSVCSQDFIASQLSDKMVLLTYKSAHLGPEGILSHHSFRSSLWQLTSDGWKLRFHQGTPTDEFEPHAI